jgi:hypothetical protein
LSLLSHARALLTSSREGRTAYIHADLRDPDVTLLQWGLLSPADGNTACVRVFAAAARALVCGG